MVNDATVALVKQFEGLELNAYPDPATHAEPYTIGWGTTIYPDGTKVKLGDTCYEWQAETYLKHDLEQFAKKVSPLIKSNLNDNQFGAIVSFAYNVGVGNLKSSTLLKKVNANPSDPAISNEFSKWNKANKKVMKGLTKRRAAEATLYFS